LLQSLSQATVDATKGDFEGIKAAHIIDTNVDRFEDFCLRVLNKSGYSDFRKTPTVYTTLFLLELVGDEYKRLAIHLANTKKVSPDLSKFIKHTDKMFNAYYNLYYSFTKEKVEEIYTLDKEGTMMNEGFYEKINSEEKEITHHLKKIGRFLVSLTELRMDLEYI